MKKKIIVTILAIILLIVTAIISIYTLAFLLSLEGTRGLRIPHWLRTEILGWETTYGSGNTFLLMQIIVFLFYLILFSAIIFLMVWIRRKIKEKNKI